MTRTRLRSVAGAAVAVLVALVLWWSQSGDGAPSPSLAPDAPSTVATGGSSPGHATDPASGLPWVDAGTLPPEAGDALRRIDAGGPFDHPQDGGTFGNFEGLLPDEPRGYYREYTVETPGSEDRGARRIVTGEQGEYYWTQDHYQSFERIRR